MDQSLFYVLVSAPLPYPPVVGPWLQDFLSNCVNYIWIETI